MATVINVTTTYSGEAQRGYISSAIRSNKSLTSGVFTVKERFNKTLVIKTLTFSGTLIKGRTKLFTPSGQVDIGERTITPKYLEVNIELDKALFEGDWDSAQQGDSAWKILQADLVKAMTDRLILLITGDLDKQVWIGDGTADKILGVLPRMKADAAIPVGQKLTNVPVTSANIIGELDRIIQGSSEDMLDNDNIAISLSRNMFRAYVSSLGGFGATGGGGNGVDGKGHTGYRKGDPLFYDGVELIDMPGMPSDHAIVSIKGDIWFGTDLQSDYNMVKMIDMTETTGDDIVRTIAKFSGDTNYGFSKDVLYYGITA